MEIKFNKDGSIYIPIRNIKLDMEKPIDSDSINFKRDKGIFYNVNNDIYRYNEISSKRLYKSRYSLLYEYI